MTPTSRSASLRPPFISSVAFRDSDIAGVLRESDALGYRGVELWEKHLKACTPDVWDAVESELTSRQMTLPVVAPFLSFTRGPERLQQTWADAEHALRVASRFGSSRFRVFTDVGRDGLGSSDASEAQWAVAAHEIAKLCRKAPDLLFVAEVHPWTLTDTPKSALRLLECVAQPNFRLNFQFIPSYLNEGWEAALQRFLPVVAHMHWQQIQSDGSMGYLNQPGVIDFPKLAKVLAAAAYDGTVTIEYCWPGADMNQMKTDRQLLNAMPEFAVPLS